MPRDWESALERWRAAGLIDAAAIERIREFEGADARPQGLRWPVVIACVLGALLLGAGVLLFVSAHWDEIGPAERMTLVLLMVAGFHAAGVAAAGRIEGLSMALHTVGTVALGAGIALAGQIFNLNEHWPSAILLWTLGAALGWALLGHWTQAALVAILGPWWLAAEWSVRMPELRYTLPIAAGACALSFTYLSARRGTGDSPLRKALCWLGGLALLPAAIVTAARSWTNLPPATALLVAWSVAMLLPFAVAILLRGREAVWNALAIAWTLGLPALSEGHPDRLPVYAWFAIGAVGLCAWGFRDARPERINLGIAGFALTVLAFYFSNVMDKLGRSASLMGLGMLFLGGGWLLERTRRRLLAHLRPEAL
jgi:uncharacterized membrane protein